MKGIVLLSVTFCIGLVKADAGSKDEQQKQSYNNFNSIDTSPKPEMLSYQQITQHYGNKYQPQHVAYQEQYQPKTQQLQQAVPYNHQSEPFKKPFVVPPHQPTPVAMVIIAQPAYIPASMLQNLQNTNVAHQLLQYFQGTNSQPRFQYVPVNHQPYYQQPYSAPMQAQHYSQYVQYRPQEEPAQYQSLASIQNNPPVTQTPSIPASTTKSPAIKSKFHAHEALPTPEALVSSHHQNQNIPHYHHLQQNQPNLNEGRSLQFHQPQQQFVDYQPQQVQQSQQQVHYQGPDIGQLAQQAAEHFLMNGGLGTETRSAPAIITGLEQFSPEQQEKIKSQLSAHFGSPLKRLNLESGQSALPQVNSLSGKKFHQDDGRQRIKSEKFVPSIQVKDGEITQTLPNAEDKI